MYTTSPIAKPFSIVVFPLAGRYTLGRRRRNPDLSLKFFGFYVVAGGKPTACLAQREINDILTDRLCRPVRQCSVVG